MKARRLIIRIAAVLVLVVIGVIMSIIGRGHTIYLDNKTLEYDGQTYKIPVPKNMDGVILNIPGYLAGLPQEAYITEFVPAVTEEPVDDEVPGGEDDLIPGTDGDSAIPDM